MNWSVWFGVAALVVDLLIRVGLSIRVIMRRAAVGVSLAWLVLVLTLPFVGAILYLLFGELRLGRSRAARAAQVYKPYREWLATLHAFGQVEWAALGAECAPLARLAESAVGVPAVPSNRLELLTDAESFFRAVTADVDRAQRSCHFEFYIWSAGGMADEAAEALARAAERGVDCRVLVDAVGSRDFLRSEQARELARRGVAIKAALAAGVIRMLFVRFDLRMHRKIVVIDGQTAYTGSQNLVDPRFFKQTSNVGQWIDAMARVEGPAVECLEATFLSDWLIEGARAGDLGDAADVRVAEPQGAAVVQVLPSGPSDQHMAIQEVLIMAIYAARKELVLTTPYFVPNEALSTALISAARRGVCVRLIVPARVDSMLVRLASQAYRGDLLEAGVQVMEFEGGLLHTKSVTVDDEFSLFGSLNLDPRSLYLNFEITLAVYDREFTKRLRALQATYLDDCRPMDLAAWRARSLPRQLAADTGRLLSPLL